MDAVIYTGQQMHVQGTYITSHMKEISERGLLIEFELSTPRGWSNLHVLFPPEVVMELLPINHVASKMNLHDGVSRAKESRVIDVVRQGQLSKYSEQEVAKKLFAAMH